MLTIFYKSDAQLVNRTLKGHCEAFTPLVERYQEIVFAVAYGIVANAADAEDVTQDTFVTAYIKLTALREPEKFRSWLLTIARNRSSDVLIKRKRETPLEGIELPATDHTDTVADAELRTLLRDRIERLPAEHREILLLHYYAGLKVREVAAQLEISTEAAKKRLQRARDLLSQRMLAQLRDTVEEQGSSAARTRTIVGLIAGASAPWLGGGAAAAGAGLLTTAGLLKLAAISAVGIGVAATIVLAGRNKDIPEPTPPPLVTQPPPNQVPAPEVTTTSIPLESAPTADALASAGTPEPEAGPHRGVIRGRVVNDSGIPQADVRITADIGDPYPPMHTETRSAPDGQFEITGLREKKPYVLQGFTASAYGTQEARARVDADSRTPIEITLLPAGDLVGAVVGPDGTPVAGATVTPSDVPRGKKSQSISRRWMALRSVQTTADGSFVLSHAWFGDWTLKIDSPDHVIKEFATTPATNRQTLRLDPGATIQGRVVYAGTDDGVPGLELQAHNDRVIKTDSQGQFILTGVDPVASNITLRNHQSLLITSPPFALFPGKTTNGVRVEVAHGGSIRGRIYDAETGEPVINPRIKFQGSRWAYGNPITNEEDGRYELTGLPPGEYRPQSVTAKDYAPLWIENAVPLQIELNSRVENMDFALKKGRVVSGRVLFPEHESLEGARIGVVYIWGDSRRTSTSRELTEDGTFRFTGLPLTGTATVKLSGAGWTNEPIPPLELSHGDLNDIVVHARQGNQGTIRGSVVYGRDVPRVGERVLLRSTEGRRTSEATTDESGGFEFKNLSAGAYTVQVVGNNEPPKFAEMLANTNVTLPPIYFTNGTNTIAGQVLDWRGKPIAGAAIRVSGTPDRVADVSTDGEGRYTLRGFGINPANITASASGFARTQIKRVIPGSTNIDFRLEPLGHAEGTIVDKNTNRPLQEFRVQSSFTFDPKTIDDKLGVVRGQRQVGPDGLFRAINLPPGEQALLAWAPGYFPNYTVVTVRPNETVTGVRIELAPAPALSVHVLDAKNRPVSDARIFLNDVPPAFDSGGSDQGTAITDTSGTTTLDYVLPGVNALYIFHPKHGRGAYQLNTDTGGDDLTFKLPAPAELAGRIMFDGLPVKGVSASLHYPEKAGPEQFWKFMTDIQNDGQYRFEKLPQGAAVMQLSHGKILRKYPLSIAPGENALDIDMHPSDGTLNIETILPPRLSEAHVHAHITVDSAGHETHLIGEADSDGTITVQNVPEGSAIIRVVAQSSLDDFTARILPHTFGPGNSIAKSIDFGQGATISGSITPNRDCHVMLFTGTIETNALDSRRYKELRVKITHQQKLDPSGSYQFDAVPPGTYTIVLADEDLENYTYHEVHVESEGLQIDLALP